MREIKFRSWFPCAKKMYQWDDGVKWYFWQYLDSPHCILMQYTGLKDKNDKEIYEGDIVKWPDSNPPYKPRFKVVSWPDPWDGACFGISGPREEPRFENDTQTTWDQLNPRIAEGIEIIGNIYENPELLKEK